MRILPIKIEIGRYRNIHLEERICELLCRMNEIEDEEHILRIYPVCDDLRRSLYLKGRDV